MSLLRIIILAAVAAICSLWVSCSPAQIAGGTDTETGGTMVTGCIRKSDDIPAPNTVVVLIPTDYNPARDAPLPRSLTDTTDADGFYAVNVPTKGRYNIQAVDLASRSRLLLRGIECSNSAVNAPVGILAAPGSVRIFLPDSIDKVNGYCYIPGTILFVRLQAKTDFVVIDSVPAGVIPEIQYASFNSSASTVIRYNIPVNSGDTANEYNPAWKYSRRITLNTSVTGAAVSGDVVHFPVLIRLNANNFNFSQAQTSGADIRFTKSDDAPLPFQIERWDAAQDRAEIWIKADTVFGNSDKQFITMYWGNSQAAPLSNGDAVFDTAAGFQGVWHLGDATEDSVRDATSNRYHGISPDTARPQVTEGVIGNCRKFDGQKDFITMPNTATGKLNFPQDGYYTVSAWVFIDTFSAKPQLIVSKGYEQYFLWAANYPGESPFWEFYEFNESTNWEWTRSPATGGQWALLAGVRQGENQFLYCNGVLVDSVKDAQPWGISRDTSEDLSIGGFLEGIYDPSYEGYCFLKGSIDEARIISAAQSPDWLRLCYMNQRSDDRLIVFK
jgi:hypothetical protein